MRNVKYTLLEIVFSNRWQWVRRNSKCFWVKDTLRGGEWVKFTNQEMKYISARIGDPNWKPVFEGAVYEDWRLK